MRSLALADRRGYHDGVSPQGQFYLTNFTAAQRAEWEERAAVMEFCGGLSREAAESEALWDVIRMGAYGPFVNQGANDPVMIGQRIIVARKALESPRPTAV